MRLFATLNIGLTLLCALTAYSQVPKATAEPQRFNLTPPEIAFRQNFAAQDFAPFDFETFWSRKDVLLWDESKNSDLLNLTARIDSEKGGTAFYVGKYAGYYLMITNYHTFSEQICANSKTQIYFQQLKQRLRCQKLIAQFKDIEVTFFAIRIPDSLKPYFETHQLKFDFQKSAQLREPLLTAGFGDYQNTSRRLTFEDSSHCMVLTDPLQPRFIQATGTPFGAWSFVHGCEISSGDSGSAVLNRNTNKIVGINWATHADKSQDEENYKQIENFIQTQSPKLWTSFSLVTPAWVIKKYVQEYTEQFLLENVQTAFLFPSATSKEILQEFLKDQETL